MKEKALELAMTTGREQWVQAIKAYKEASLHELLTCNTGSKVLNTLYKRGLCFSDVAAIVPFVNKHSLWNYKE